MATAKQTKAARQNVGKAQKAAASKRTIANMPKRTRTALGQQGAAVAQRKRTGGDSPKPGGTLRDRQAARPAGALQDGTRRARQEARREVIEMARAIWSGVLTFGLVSVPVELYSATEAHGPVFHQFEKGTADRIRYQRVNERTTDEVEYSNIVKGAETGGGHYVMLDQDELDSVAPGRSRSMEIRTFVDLDDIDPIYFNKTYYLGPGSEETGKVYALLRAAMGDSDKAAIASFVMRGKEYLAAVRPTVTCWRWRPCSSPTRSASRISRSATCRARSN